ncbi:MAG: hypothetical protein WCK37_04775 [Candidatus Falkowbacteria bacterium]
MKSSVVALLSGLIIILGLEAMLLWPTLFLVPLIIINLAIFFSVFLLVRENNLRWRWIVFSALPIIFINALVVSCGLIPQITLWNKILLQIIFFAAVYFFLFYIRNLWLYFNFPERPNNLDNFSFGMAIVTAFFCSSAIFGLQLFLSLPYLILAVIIAAILTLLVFCNLWMSRLFGLELWPLLLILFFLFIQIVWALYFLPFDYTVLSFVMTLVFYLALSLARLDLRQMLNRHNLKPLLIYVGIVLLIILATVRWH